MIRLEKESFHGVSAAVSWTYTGPRSRIEAGSNKAPCFSWMLNSDDSCISERKNVGVGTFFFVVSSANF